MKEISDIIKAYKEATLNGLNTALATVVKVDGSSYRQPGARMLVTEDGNLTGAISGGCLEGDALKKALLTIHQRQNKLITYDTSNPDDLEFGVQLGCNGIVYILFEFIDGSQSDNPIRILEKALKTEGCSVISTLFCLENKSVQIGTVSLSNDDENIISTNSSICDVNEIQRIANESFNSKKSVINEIFVGDLKMDLLSQYLAAPIKIIIAGAGNDAMPVVEMISILGWETIVMDGRATHATKRRFPSANKVLLTDGENVLENIEINENTFFVLMTHNYRYDLTLLRQILKSKVKYIGLLGPKSKLERMLDDLREEDVRGYEDQLKKLHGPVGLDIGAETSEEIALSIVSEIQAVLTGRNGNFLKNLNSKIHFGTYTI